MCLCTIVYNCVCSFCVCPCVWCVCACVRACSLCVCACACMCACVVGLVACHSSGVANDSSPGIDHAVDTRQGQGALELALQANNRLNTMHTLHLRSLQLSVVHPPSLGVHSFIWPK